MDYAKHFAKRWIADWNSHDLDAILAHYSESAQFNSPFAKLLTGSGVVVGRENLQTYWAAGLRKRPGLRFELINVFSGHQSIAIHYRDEMGRVAIETMVFDDAGKDSISAACYDRV